jgi:hypothetical protein
MFGGKKIKESSKKLQFFYAEKLIKHHRSLGILSSKTELMSEGFIFSSDASVCTGRTVDWP